MHRASFLVNHARRCCKLGEKPFAIGIKIRLKLIIGVWICFPSLCKSFNQTLRFLWQSICQVWEKTSRLLKVGGGTTTTITTTTTTTSGGYTTTTITTTTTTSGGCGDGGGGDGGGGGGADRLTRPTQPDGPTDSTDLTNPTERPSRSTGPTDPIDRLTRPTQPNRLKQDETETEKQPANTGRNNLIQPLQTCSAGFCSKQKNQMN